MSSQNRQNFLKETTGKIIIQDRGLLNVLSPLMKVGLPFIKYVLTPLSESVLISLGLTATSSAKWISHNYTDYLKLRNERHNKNMKNQKNLEKSSLLTKVLRQTTKNEAKRTKTWFSFHVTRYFSC